MGERLVRGRTITAADTSDSQLVALVNETLARLYFAGRDPIGGRMKIGGGDPRTRPWVTVVGIVADVRHNGITEPSKKSSTFRTRSGTDRSATRFAGCRSSSRRRRWIR